MAAAHSSSVSNGTESPKAKPLWISWLVQVLPTFLVLLGLSALAGWGHFTGWKLPKFSTLIGGEEAKARDWCDEHGVAESECVECNPNLLPKGKAPPYCKIHGIPECPIENPEIAQVTGKPQFPKYDTRVALELLARTENNSRCKLHERRIQFASAAAFDKAGVDVKEVQEAPMSEYLTANGEIGYDQSRTRLCSRVAGSVWRVYKNVGDPVREGEVLALVDAAEVGKAKTEYLQAVAQLNLRTKNFEAVRQLMARGATTEAIYRTAENEVSEGKIRVLGARQALINFGLPVNADAVRGLTEEQLAAHVQLLGLPYDLREHQEPNGISSNLLPVVAPVAGVVVAREVVAGEVVDNARTLFVIADPRQVWLTLHVRQEDARYLGLGLPVRFRAQGDAAEVGGNVSLVSTEVDEKTRTVKVRATLPNSSGSLRANTFGPGRIILREEKHAVVVPNEAVHWDGSCFVVFVRDRNYLTDGAPKVFHVRKVRPGARDDTQTELLAGVLPGEVVATAGSGILLAELLTNKLGDG
jgi:cobalt-zinc-cadmium efflux system membrane fusion protein